jgi:hypothetical protein
MGERDQSHLAIEDIIRIAKETALKRGGHLPTVIVEGSKKSGILVLEEFPKTHEEKVYRMFSMGLVMAKSDEVGDLTQIYFISEGWMSNVDEGKLINTMPSLDPNRKEVLIVSTISVEAHQSGIAIYEMIRNPNGKLIELQELSPPITDGEGNVESPLLDAFVDGFGLGRKVRIN